MLLVAWHRRIDVGGPGINAAREVPDLRKSESLVVLSGTQAPATVVKAELPDAAELGCDGLESGVAVEAAPAPLLAAAEAAEAAMSEAAMAEAAPAAARFLPLPRWPVAIRVEGWLFLWKAARL